MPEKNGPPLEDLPVFQLRRYTLRGLFMERNPKVKNVKGRKVEATKTLLVEISWEPQTTMFQMRNGEAVLGHLLKKWIWDGWTFRLTSR